MPASLPPRGKLFGILYRLVSGIALYGAIVLLTTAQFLYWYEIHEMIGNTTQNVLRGDMALPSISTFNSNTTILKAAAIVPSKNHFRNNNSSGNATTMQTTKAQARKIRLFHVMNIYATNREAPSKNDNSKSNGNTLVDFQSFDQWVTLQSIHRAKQTSMPNGFDIQVVCAILESDWEALTEERVPICDHRVRLERSTRTEYVETPISFKNRNNGWLVAKKVTGESANNSNKSHQHNNNNNNTTNIDTIISHISELFSKRELPFVQDILDAGISVASKSNGNIQDDYYIMMTNSDIGVTEHFYDFLYRQLQEGRKALTINRLTLPLTNETNMGRLVLSMMQQQRQQQQNPTTTNNQVDIKRLLNHIHNNIVRGKGTVHPGHDCFVIHSSIVGKVFLGNQFPGFPAWAKALQIILRDILAQDTYKMIPSTPNATFHLGDDKAWKSKRSEDGDARRTTTTEDDEAVSFRALITSQLKRNIQDCPIKRTIHNTLSGLNMASCGLVFREHYPEFLAQLSAGICPYHPGREGWAPSQHKGCEAFRLGMGPYPFKDANKNKNTEY